MRLNFRMDKLNHYRELVKKVLIDYNTPRIAPPNYIPDQLIFDEVRNHYQILANSWRGRQRIYFIIFHLDIINEKIWLQENATDHDIVEDLLNLGVPNTDIVLGFCQKKHVSFLILL